MHVRRLVRMGKSSCVVSLPKGWVDKKKLGPGSHIYIEELPGGSLVLNPKSVETKAKPIEVKLDEAIGGKRLKRLIISNYLKGFGRINMVSDKNLSPGILDDISKAADSLIGLEIVEQSLRKVSLECLVKPEELPIDKLIRRMYLLAKDMHSEAIEVLYRGKPKLAKGILDRDKSVNRLYFLGKRYLNLAVDPEFSSKIGLSMKNSLSYQSVLKRIERIADHSKNIARYLQRISFKGLPKNLLERVKGINERINSNYDKAVLAFFKKDLEGANSVIDEQESIKDEFKALAPSVIKLSGNNMLNMAYILESSLRISGYSADIAEVVIDRAG